MANYDKDLSQKEMAIRYCLLNELIPCLEVDVKNYRELSDTSTLITDIDVLGVRVESSGRVLKVIFDCKTLNKTSSINRAFWAAGLMRFIDCSEAFVILKKQASEAHRLSAKQICVHLFDERQFSNYSNTFSVDFSRDYCYSTSISNWVKLHELTLGDKNLTKYFEFLKNDVPNEMDSARVFRKFLKGIDQIRGELDPSKNRHRALFYYSLSMLMFLMAKIVHDLRAVIDYDVDDKEYERIVKYYIWGGRDSFLLKNKIVESFKNSVSGVSAHEPEIKNWIKFLEVTRSLLDSPVNIQKCVFPLREMAFIECSEKVESKDLFVANYIKTNGRIRQFSMAVADYVVDAIKLPKDFSRQLRESFDRLREL